MRVRSLVLVTFVIAISSAETGGERQPD